jgi:hypothetical protein
VCVPVVWGYATDFYPAEAEIEEACDAVQYSEEVDRKWMQPSIASPSLSKPAARPTGFEILVPKSEENDFETRSGVIRNEDRHTLAFNLASSDKGSLGAKPDFKMLSANL